MSQQNFGTYSVKNVKTFTGMEGCGGFNCTVYNGSKKIATAIDDDSGAPVNIDFIDGWNSDEAKAIKAFAKTRGKGDFEVVECFISEMVHATLQERWMKRHCKRKTMFRIKGDKEGTYRTLNAPYSEQVMAYLRKQHGQNIIELYDAEGKRLI